MSEDEQKHKISSVAREHEREKTRQQRAEDIAYTINHAISCGLTDIAVQPYVGVWTINGIEKAVESGFPSWLKWLQNIFEKPHSHDHGHGHGHGHAHEHGHEHGHAHHEHCGHEHHGPKKAAPLKTPTFWHNVMHWTSAEVFGDVGAVPATIIVQRMFPGMMQGIRQGLEPVAGKTFHKGAHKASLKWAEKQGYADGSPEQIAKENELYEYEMSHLPQAVVWNCFAFPANVILQKKVFKGHGDEHSWGTLIAGKTFGALFSNTALIGGRAALPDVAHQWDQWNGENIIVPTTKVIGGVFGVDHETSERIARRHAESEGKGWQGKEEVKRAQTQEQGSVKGVAG